MYESFKDVWTFPLKPLNCIGKVYDSKFNMAFDFVNPFMKGLFKDHDILCLDEDIQQEVVKKLNDEKTDLFPFEILSYKDGYIFFDNKIIIVIRGWGYMKGRLGLEPELAIKLQDEFAEFIINKLN